MPHNPATMFIPEKPCKNGHFLKYHASGNCVICNRQAVSKSRKKRGYKTDPEYLKNWWVANPHKQKEYDAKRAGISRVRGRIRVQRSKTCTPSWLTPLQKQEIKELYLLCKEVSAMSGIPHEVDHVIPIAGRKVCGLHVPWNLEIIPRKLNRCKQNKMEK